MTQTKLLPNTAHKSGPLLSPREEAERFAVAAARFRERMIQDPAVAEKLLRDIGYYEMMEQQRLEEQEEAQNAVNGTHSNGASNGDETPADEHSPAISPQ